METLKIALASDWFYPKIGGIETHVQELALNLLRLGHEPHVITHDYRKFGSKFQDNFPFKVHRLHGEIYNSQEHISLGIRTIYEANKLYKKERFDLTHIHSIYSPLGIIIANISRGLRGVPVVATNHSFFEWKRRRWKLWLPILRYALKRVDAFIAVSRAVARDTRKLLKNDPRPLHIVPNAVDTSFWRPPDHEERMRARAAIGASQNDVVIFAPGRFTERKRIHVVPRIVAEASKSLSRTKHKRLYLVIVGDGPYRPVIENEISQYKAKELFKAYMNGFVERKMLREYYWAADLTIVPSPIEAFSITALESMACGTPVLGYRGGGIEDVVVDGVTGFLVKDDEEAVNRLVFLAESDDIRAKMREHAPYHVARNFSWNKIVYEILEIYKSVLDSSDPEEKLFLLYKGWLRLSKLWKR
ncbi:glycosyltransferase family 4 protein [Pyrofollis japonicus]|uniref:glycosyltransferase family 4 protein n=1 Tax=Pyrofollis japonicus TaxID=3060460 RepID=UPI00295AE880|nr:glycosyltransferase family 4 protein [Pyrofollis japonicus]BEP17671.1 glycosyltransferase family 4 protein [Pyrofollis japonicus]